MPAWCGYSPKLFQSILTSGFDILTYRKGRFRKVPKKKFQLFETTIEGKAVSYHLADQGVRLLRGKLSLRQVTRRSDNGHQTPILTSRTDLSTVEVAFRMFERWRQADYGIQAFTNVERIRPTIRGFKIANGPLGKRFLDASRRVHELCARRPKIPTRVPVQAVRDTAVIKLAPDKKHLTNLLKMVAYQAESDLVRQITPHFSRAADEGRTRIQTILAAPADIAIVADELRITVAPLSTPHWTRALTALCKELDHKKTIFPGSRLRLRYAVADQVPR